jgi:hypothetical protein
MMWEDSDEPLYDERILGEPVRFLWKQVGAEHFIRAEWIRGQDPWDIESCETRDRVRYKAIDKATLAIEQLIHEKRKV